ncbi:hypothetical protein NPS70_27070 [Streptomyces sp. C10-9-1]|nr:hypothetical protein [Streptomyces sp. C10-9-1]MCQ6556821.1 hypothetical protein [Streptomyces sp. C10-9-1]
MNTAAGNSTASIRSINDSYESTPLSSAVGIRHLSVGTNSPIPSCQYIL